MKFSWQEGEAEGMIGQPLQTIEFGNSVVSSGVSDLARNVINTLLPRSLGGTYNFEGLTNVGVGPLTTWRVVGLKRLCGKDGGGLRSYFTVETTCFECNFHSRLAPEWLRTMKRIATAIHRRGSTKLDARIGDGSKIDPD